MSERIDAGISRITEVFTPLPRASFGSTADKVAPDLLGHWLIRRTSSGVCGGLIVETEAYLADDPACHAFRGKTERNRAMWGPPGHAYVYFIYGNHYCVNAVCQPAGTGEAVLIRALQPMLGEAWMRKQRPVKKHEQLTNGPAKLCEAMGITQQLDGVDLCNPKSPLVIARNERVEEFVSEMGPTLSATRIGITKAMHVPLRFYLEGSPFVSRRERGSRRS